MLSALYESSGGDGGWYENTNWLERDTFPCTGGWYGVVCDGSGPDGLIGLDLEGNRITGIIPTELGLLSTLHKGLYLGQNDMTGTLPTELGNLQNLTGSFSFFSNELTRSIPTELGRLRFLTSNFRIEDNYLSKSLPTQIGKLGKMEYNLFYLKYST